MVNLQQYKLESDAKSTWGNVSTQGAVTFAKVEQIFIISIGIYSPDQLSDKQAADLRNKL